MSFLQKAYRAFNEGCDWLIGKKVSRMVVVVFSATALLVGLSELSLVLKAMTTILVIARIFWLEGQTSDNQKNRSWKVALATKAPVTAGLIWISTWSLEWKIGIITVVVSKVIWLERQKRKNKSH